MASAGKSNEEQIEERVNLYKAHIVECVCATELLISLHIIDKAKKQEIRQIKQQRGDMESTIKLLDFIKETQEPGKWTAFVESLKAADYEYLADALRRGERIASEDVAHHKHIIDTFGPKIVNKLNPSNLVGSLVCYKVINKQDKEEIEAERICRGDIAASIVLLERIPKRVRDWYKLFLQSVHEAEEGKQDLLINKIDPDFLEKYHAQRKDDPSIQKYHPVHSSLDSTASSDAGTMEDYASGFGEAVSDGNLNAPSSLGYGSLCSKTADELPHMGESSATPSLSGKLAHQQDMLSDVLNSLNIDGETSVKEFRPSAGASGRNGPLSRLLDVNAGSVPRMDFSNITIPQRYQEPSSPRTDGPSSMPSFSQRSSISSLSFNGHGRGNILLNTRNRTGADLENQLNQTNEDVEKTLGLKEKRNISGKANEEAESSVDNIDYQMEDDKEDSAIQRETLNLRDYQMELADSGLKGHNCIIVAPTGSGKTHVALKIIEQHFKIMRGRRNPKVAFLVEQNALAEQQGKMCRQYLSQNVKVITGETQRTENFQDLSQWIKRREVLVVTAQLLVNALCEKNVEITQFSLLVFDECHHSNFKHSFNRIMHHYIDIKLDPDTDERKVLPQVVGLTASVGVGKAKKKEDAITWIEKIMAHLDAQDLCTVRRCTAKLQEYVSLPEQSTEQVQGRKSNVFGQAINNLMAKIEQYMQKSEHARTLPDAHVTLRAPARRGDDPYTQWLSRLWNETAKVFDQAARRFFTTCRNYLDLYNKSLIIYHDARVKDALDFLDDSIRAINEHSIKDNTDRKMELIFEGSRPLLENCLYNPEHVNPKLEKLKEMLVEAYRQKEDSRGIIFVKTRDLVKAIESWMKDDIALRKLNPVKFVGAQASIQRGGMTKNEQVDVLQYFRDGQHKVIIATSVAEEGLDIQKCNLVIRYDYVTNEIAMVQSRGRGRAEDSKYVLVAAEGGMAAQKEEINLMREAMMNKAIERLQERIQRDKDGFQRRIRKLQMEEKLARDMEASKGTRRSVQEGQFELRCGKCHDFICMSSDVKTIMSAHHAVLCDDITDRVAAKRLNKAQYSDQQLQSGIGKITCRKCGSDLGNVSTYNAMQFPIIKIASFSIVDVYGNAACKKKWKDVPFHVAELSNDDLQTLLRRGTQRLNLLPC
ncbi:ATP-dependent RNA helicase DHX58-like [Argopecten irradians]|uniref:ATP-dependent RNA helicase DHX58-like n=1 Tax=Argopecten irradians TaxID=31199 RepID=UPI0037249B74